MGNFFKWKLLSYTLVSVFCSTNTFAKDCFSKDWSKFHEIEEAISCDLNSKSSIDTCVQESCGMTMAMNDCYKKYRDVCQSDMKNLYNSLLEKAKKKKFAKDDEFNLRKGQPEERLTNSQDFWNKYIEHHCTVDIDFNGSIASSFYNECIAEKTKERIKELQKLQ